MANIEIRPLTDRLAEDEIADLHRALQAAGAPKLPKSDEAGVMVARNIDDDVMAEFLDRLDASDMACDVYLPIELDGRIGAADLQVGSLAQLVEVLDEMRDDLSVGEDDEDEEEEEEHEEEEEYEDEEEEELVDEEESDELELVEKQLRRLWKDFYQGAHMALERHLPMFVSVR
ncbi:MAG: hypothetical protein HY698_13300 [Deltaproteobacteria bacterium]|nr:hypothetical protein [Deltaproteobacteria bacterium]